MCRQKRPYYVKNTSVWLTCGWMLWTVALVSLEDAGDSMLQINVSNILLHACAETALVCQSGNPIKCSDNRNHKCTGLLSCIGLFIYTL